MAKFFPGKTNGFFTFLILCIVLYIETVISRVLYFYALFYTLKRLFLEFFVFMYCFIHWNGYFSSFLSLCIVLYIETVLSRVLSQIASKQWSWSTESNQWIESMHRSNEPHRWTSGDFLNWFRKSPPVHAHKYEQELPNPLLLGCFCWDNS